MSNDTTATTTHPTEQEMRDAKVPWLDSEEALIAYIRSLVDRPHDYGTAAYAMSMAATAAFNYAANKLGTTGFQASCADLDFLRRSRGYKHGFHVIDYSKLLYPQSCNEESVPGFRSLLADERVNSQLRKAAAGLIEEMGDHAAPRVLRHWRELAEGRPLTAAEWANES